MNPPGKNPPGKNPPGKNPPGKNPPGKNPPGKNPPGKNPPGKNPPGKNPPGNRPPGKNPPGNRPPGKNPPGNRPPGKRPPGNRPPGNRPPGNRPPIYRPPIRPPYYGGGYWRPNWRWRWQIHAINWWTFATADSIAGWLNSTLGQPYYYDYGENLYYQDGSVYVEGAAVATEEQYAAGAKKIAESVPEVDPEKVEWLPLGVFAITQKDRAIPIEDSNLFLQLAISREGIIAGTFQDTAADNAFEVEGTIDKNSQRAAFSPSGKEWPVVQTGIYNLTNDETDVLVHFESGETQHWKLVRIKETKKDDPEKKASSDKAKTDQPK